VCDDKGTLHIRVEGPWLHTILFEVPILSIVSEVYSREMNDNFDLANTRTLEKMELLENFFNESQIRVRFADFGGRRRHSKQAQENAISLAIKAAPKSFIGTSNVMFAKQFGIKPIGTMAHEWLQAHQAFYRLADSQSMAFDHWAREYRGDLGVALSDVIGLEYFLHDFDMFFAKLFDGTRQDSGDPIDYGEKIIRHYKKMGIDPMTKSVVFSDGLDFKRVIEIAEYFNGKIKHSFGIGTNFTNDFDFKALQLVLKMVKCNGNPVAKLSDSPGKGMCTDEDYVDYLRVAFDRRLLGG
jgi:nicotinate phosphoribosyltransferase